MVQWLQYPPGCNTRCSARASPRVAGCSRPPGMRWAPDAGAPPAQNVKCTVLAILPFVPPCPLPACPAYYMQAATAEVPQMVQDSCKACVSPQECCTHHNAVIKKLLASAQNMLTGLRTSPPVGGRNRNLMCVQRLPGGLLQGQGGPRLSSITSAPLTDGADANNLRLTLSRQLAAGTEDHISEASSTLKPSIP